MKRYQSLFFKFFHFYIAAILMAACISEDERPDTPAGNFEALWQIIDEHYCFFAYKQHEYGLDWQEVYNKYKVRVNEKMTEVQLFEVLCDMLAELRDGHVNLSTSYDYGRYWTWQEAYPKNFSDTLYLHYMGTDYRIASSLSYRVLDDNIGYIRCASFENAIGEGNLDDVLAYFILCRGLIIDVRNNGGGLLTNVETLVSRFIQEKTLAGYISHKTGPGHNDVSEPYAYYFEPTKNHIHYLKPVVVLANRGSFSATNNFVSIMKSLDQVTIVGDTTGGGCGLPFTSELPNGWRVRLSSCPIMDAQGKLTEFGVAPDQRIDMNEDDRTHDAILDAAVKVLSTLTASP